MRPFEFGLLLTLLAYILHLLSPSRGESFVFAFFPFIAALIAISQVTIEGYRWQMLPAYCLTVFFIVFECIRWFSIVTMSYWVGVGALFFVLIAIALSTILPIFKLPAPTGPYKLGTEIRYLIDKNRRDPFSDRSDQARELMMQIWYPTDPLARGPIAPYRDKRITSFWDARFALVKSHSIIDAPLSHSKSQYPLVLYVPSWDGIRTESTFQIEELASHGYIVVGIDHPYSSRITVFPDGRIARRKFTGEEDYSSQAVFEAFVKTAEKQVEIRTRDVSFVLDTLEWLNLNDPQGLLTGHIDFARVGIFGSSFGGTTAAETCWRDRRFRAGIDMGGMIAGESKKHGTFAPFMFMFEGRYGEGPYVHNTDLSSFGPSERREIEFGRSQFAEMKRSLSEFGGYWLTIRRFNHMNFFDAPLYSPLRYNRVDPERALRVTSRYVLAFFEKYLKGIDQPLLTGESSKFPEVDMRAWKTKAPVTQSVR